MCGIIGFGVAGLIGAIALVFGVGSMFNGVAAAGTSMALLGQTLIQPIMLVIAGLFGVVGGAGLALGAPTIIRFVLAVRAGREHVERLVAPPALLGSDMRRESLPDAQAQALPAPRQKAIRRHVARRPRIRINSRMFDD